jgi:hypothetical protein
MDNQRSNSEFRAAFVHFCPYCARRQMLDIEAFGKSAKCDGCGRSSIAVDRDIESAALLDTMKSHAELARRPATEDWKTQRPR